MKNKSLVAAVFLIIIAGGASYLYSKTSRDGADKEIRRIVAEFGQTLKAVPLAMSKGDLVQAIKNNYSPFVSPELLAAWEENPERAPGRFTSSPWPDRIEILLVERDADGSYAVQGKVVEVTSTGKSASSAIASQYQVAMKMRRRDGKWVITGFTKLIPQKQP